MTTDIPSSITTPDKVDTRLGTISSFGGNPDAKAVEMLYDNLDFQRGVEAFLNTLQGASLVGLRRGLQEAGAKVGADEDCLRDVDGLEVALPHRERGYRLRDGVA